VEDPQPRSKLGGTPLLLAGGENIACSSALKARQETKKALLVGWTYGLEGRGPEPWCGRSTPSFSAWRAARLLERLGPLDRHARQVAQ
jgi:hypothetical protein